MIKRIISLLLATVILFGILPLSVFAEQDTPPATLGTVADTIPKVSVSSLYYYQDPYNSRDYRALPDDSGLFCFDISLSSTPDTAEEIRVYYRTVNDSAVAEWGDYEEVGVQGDTYVTLNEANRYTARVTVQSIILDDAFRGPLVGGATSITNDMILSRKFSFELIKVVGNAVLDTSEGGRNKIAIDCHLKAERYHYQNVQGEPTVQLFTEFRNKLSTPQFNGTYEAPLHISFDEAWSNYAATGDYSIGLSLFGDCYESYWNSDGPVTLDLYYEHEGKKKLALSLYLEGEWDDSTFFGWELAYNYIDNRIYEDEDGRVDIEDFWEDNFIGFQLYNNDAFSRSDAYFDTRYDTASRLKEARIKGYAVSGQGTSLGDPYQLSRVHYLKIPSDFVLADSYSVTIYSQREYDGETGDPRWLQDISFCFALMGNEQPRISETDNGTQLVSTNIDKLIEGDPVKMSIRFDRFVSLDPYQTQHCWVEADINGQYPIKLMSKRSPSGDTLVFEGELPEDLPDIKIDSLENIRLVENGYYPSITSFITSKTILGRNIDDLLNYNCDLRAPVARLGTTEESTEAWRKDLSLSVSLTDADTNSRFVDYATVYYLWSDSPELPDPDAYRSSVTLHTAVDREITKQIVGTGSGMLYLHMKTVSRYGKESISDRLTVVYDPTDTAATYTPFGSYKFDNEPPKLAEELEIDLTAKTVTFTLPIPLDENGSGFKQAELYYFDPTTGGTKRLRTFLAGDFSGDPKTKVITITNSDVGVGITTEGDLISERREIEFYWILEDNIGNRSEKLESFTHLFDTHDTLDDVIIETGSHNVDAARSEQIDSSTYVYTYGNESTYEFFFLLDKTKIVGDTEGQYRAIVEYNGEALTNDQYELLFSDLDQGWKFVVRLKNGNASGQYKLGIVRYADEGGGEGAEGSGRFSSMYSVYLTAEGTDETATKKLVAAGTLLNNKIYRLSFEDPYFYYMDENGAVKKEYYNNTKQPASFSSFSKAEEYVYFKELSDIYLVEIDEGSADALNGNRPGWLKATGETVTAAAGQYWIRYKSRSWTPTSGESAWVYYYYGESDSLSPASFSSNLTGAIEAVSARIAGYGQSVMLTDASLFLGAPVGEMFLDEYGMPYLLPGQIHYEIETANKTKCQSSWNTSVVYTGDKSIYKSDVMINMTGGREEKFPLVGNFAIPQGSRFQYKTYVAYHQNSSDWITLDMKTGDAFVKVFKESGIYYIREMSREGVSEFPIYVDKSAPKVKFFKTGIDGNRQEISVDGVTIRNIAEKELWLGAIDSTEKDSLSYVAVYKRSDNSLINVYSADMLNTAVKLGDGDYKIVVADRSGNHYTVEAKINSTPFECQVKESPDRFIKLTCNRRSDQILRYEVYLNGVLVTSTYEPEKNFDGAGYYTIYLQDIYGEEFRYECLFTRNYPTVTWKYFGEDGKYHTYDPAADEKHGFVMVGVAENKYKISASAKMRFSFSENYVYEFVGTAPEYVETIGSETVVTIDEGQSFTLKVYYKRFPDNYTLYSCAIDVTPPNITLEAEIDLPINDEYALFEQWIKNGNDGDVIDLSGIGYSVLEKTKKIIENGGTVSSDFIHLTVTDANDVSSVEIYLDGVLIKRQDATTGFSQLVLSRWGSYRIIAKDGLGNTSEFTFVNGKPDRLDYFIDDVLQEIDLHAYLDFEIVDGKKVFTKLNYGNRDFKIEVKENSDVFLSIAVSDGRTIIYGLRIKNGCVYPLTYRIAVDEDGEKTVKLHVGNAILDASAADFEADKERRINETDKDAYAAYVSISSEGIVRIRVGASDDTDAVVTVNARLAFETNDTFFVGAQLSGKGSEITLLDKAGEKIELSPQENDARTNESFVVDEVASDPLISNIEIYYSKVNDLTEDSLEGRDNLYASGRIYSEEGFYLLRVRNLFGNEILYRVSISSGFGITSSVEFGDGEKFHYSKDHVGILYSNHKITLNIHNEGVIYTIRKDGAAYSNFGVEIKDGTTYLTFSEEGVYDVTLTDSFGNVIQKELSISRTPYGFKEELIYGYNEKALKREEGYTNQKLSINKELFDQEEISYLAIQCGERIEIIFDILGETQLRAEAEDMIDIIGGMGDGTYTVLFRNRYGALATKVIYYRETPTLRLERTTRSDSESQVYDLARAIELGFWSNNTLDFYTDAVTYTFTVNGNLAACPRTIAFESTGETGSHEYDISYIDEYGFEYRFKAYLVRKDVSVSVPSALNIVDVDGILCTRENLSVSFEENAYAFYTRNQGKEVAYQSGTVLKQDGTYRFTVIDYAGNITTMTVKKDTAVEFEFFESSTGNVLENGSVSNASKIKFDSVNNDKVTLVAVVHNGVHMEEYKDNAFTEDGKWEIILSDDLGNEAYFCFYIVTHQKNGFEYTTPYEHRIKEMWYDSGDGIKVSYLQFVTHSESGSSFSVTENGIYTVLMISDITGKTQEFTFEVDTTAPNVSLVGCNDGESTINIVSITGCEAGDTVRIYKMEKTGETLVREIEVISAATAMPKIEEGGEYRIVVESAAGVQTELSFIKKHVMNTAGSVFIMVMIGIAVTGLLAGQIYRNKSKTDD